MTPQYDKLPTCVRGPIERYIEQGIAPGTGLTMALQHDLMAVCAVDDDTYAVLRDLMRWLHCEAPSMCHGTRERVWDWVERGGRMGREKAA